MALYAVGDLQGCLDEFQRLLDKIGFDPAADRLWLTGDLVNRGPKSLQTLRFVRALGGAAVSVLGNHDLHLLAVSAGGYDGPRPKDTIAPILAAEDGPELLDWLRRRPLLHHDEALQVTMAHAGIPPQWDLARARTMAEEAQATLGGDEYEYFLRNMYGNEPALWRGGLSRLERLRFTVNGFTRMRFCTPEGGLVFKPKGPPGSQPPGLLPWFQVPGRRSRGQRIVFGHWSALGRLSWPEEDVYGIDTGCVWGNCLTALRLDGEPEVIQLPCGCPAKL
jgi:bis(5'-nucleosyl)-tetraphosphatase (symmetrical)